MLRIQAKPAITDREKARVQEILTNIACKVLIVRVVLTLWVASCICFFINPSKYLAATTAVLPVILRIIRHYFSKESH